MQRVGLVSFMHESNSFNPVKTTIEMFENTSLLSGDEILKEWSSAHHEIGGMIEAAEEAGFEIVPLLAAWAVPAGPLEAECYDTILERILTCLRSGALNGLLLSLHGAMVAEHCRDADGNTCRRIRNRLRPSIPIVLTLDLHANVSRQMVANVDATIVYRTYPHLDQRERGREAALLMGRILRGEVRPAQAVEKPPMLMNLLAQGDQFDPMKSLWAFVEQIRGREQVIGASIACGFPYADVEEVGPAIIIVTDGDQCLAGELARELSLKAWEMREKFKGSALTVTTALEYIKSSKARPVTLLDVGDNVGGGSPGDSTVLFEALLQDGIHEALVTLCDPPAVQKCLQTGVGNKISLKAGGKTDHLHGAPVLIEGIVRSLHDGIFVEDQARHGGKRLNHQGLTAVVETFDQDTVVLTSLRVAPFSLEQLTSLGIRPERKRALIVKGAIAPRAAYESISAAMIAVDTPGITAANAERFPYRFRRRPLFPLDDTVEFPAN